MDILVPFIEMQNLENIIDMKQWKLESLSLIFVCARFYLPNSQKKIKIQVRIRTSLNGDDVRLVLSTADSVAAAKEKLAQQAQLLPNTRQRWYFGGKLLGDTCLILAIICFLSFRSISCREIHLLLILILFIFIFVLHGHFKLKVTLNSKIISTIFR